MKDSSLYFDTVSAQETTATVMQNIATQTEIVDWTLWFILWFGFGITSIVTAVQVCRPTHSHHVSLRDVEQGAHSGNSPPADGVSSGDLTRQLFYKLLLVALLSRFLLLPIQAWLSVPSWWQFLADTLPIMTFASAWALLVSFFVQLVETASGMTSESTSNNTIVMQVIAYVMYGLLLITYIWNDAAVLLVYALLACIYAALFATLVYVGPKLLSLLKPTLARRSGLAVRLILCGLCCFLVFGFRTVGLSRKVLLLQQKKPQWWYNYGALELLPAVAFLILMQKRTPRNNITSRDGSPNAAAGTTPPTAPAPRTTSRAPPQPSISTSLRQTSPPLLDKSTKSAASKPFNKSTLLSRPATSETAMLLRKSHSGGAYGTNDGNTNAQIVNPPPRSEIVPPTITNYNKAAIALLGQTRSKTVSPTTEH